MDTANDVLRSASAIASEQVLVPYVAGGNDAVVTTANGTFHLPLASLFRSVTEIRIERLSLSASPPFLQSFYRGQQTFSALNPNFAFITCEVAPTFYDLWLIMSVLPWVLITVFVCEAGIRIACREYSSEEEEEREARRDELRRVLGDDLDALGDETHQEALYRAFAYERDRNRAEIMTGITAQPFFKIQPDLLEATIRETELRQRRHIAKLGTDVYMGSHHNLTNLVSKKAARAGSSASLRRASLRRSGSFASMAGDDDDEDSYDAMTSLEGSVLDGSGSESDGTASVVISDAGSNLGGSRSRRQSMRQLRRTSSVVFATNEDGEGGVGSINIPIPAPESNQDREARRKRREKRRKRDKHVARNEDGTRKGKCSEFSEVMCVTVIIILFLLFPTLLEMNGRMLRCEEIDHGRFGTKSYLVTDRSIRCDTDTHVTYERVATFQFIAYVLFVPIFAVGVVKVMAHLTMGGSMEAARKAFFFMTGGLHPNRWWWEGWVTVRKAALVAAFLFVGHERLRVYLDMWFIGAAIAISRELRPFQDVRVGHLEMLSLTAIFVTFNLGLLFSVYEQDSLEYTLVAVAIFLLNVLVILCFVIAIIYVARLVVLEMLRDMGSDVRVPLSPEEAEEETDIDELEERNEALAKEYAKLKVAADGLNTRFRAMSALIRELEARKLRDHPKVDAAISAYVEFLASAQVRLTGFNSSPADIEALFDRERRVVEAWRVAELQARAATQRRFRAKGFGR